MPLFDANGRALPESSPVDRLDGYTPTRPVNPEYAGALASDALLSGDRLDGFINQVTGLGTLEDKTLGGHWGGPRFGFTIRGYAECEARYRGSDLGRNLVDIPCTEMLRRGWDLEVQPSENDAEIAADLPAKLDACRKEPKRAAAGWRRTARRLDGVPARDAMQRAMRWDAVAAGLMPPEAAPAPPPGPLPKINEEGADIGDAVQKWADRLPTNEGIGATAAIFQALRYERAFGGGCVFIGVDDGGRPLTEPLDWTRVKRITHLNALRGGFDGEVVMWRPYRFLTELKYGLPEIFQCRNANVPIAAVPAPGENMPPDHFPPSPSGPTLFYVHESRFLIFDGEPTSISARQEMRGWGDSIFTRVNDPLLQFEQNWNAVAILMQEASIASVGIDGFTRALGEKGVDARNAFTLYAQTQSMMRSVARTNYHDATQKFERQGVTFSGISEILNLNVERICASLSIPVSVLWGNLKGGLGAKEDPSARGWYATIEARQERRLRPALEKLYLLGMQSKEGPTRGVVPDKWDVLFRPLWQLTELEQAELRSKTSAADALDIQNQIVTPAEVAATRYGGVEYNPGSIVIDMEARTASRSVTAPVGEPVAPPAAESTAPAPPDAPIKMMPTDPWTAAPTAVASASGETAGPVPAGTAGVSP